MNNLQFFEEKLKGVSPFTKKNYSVYIRLLDTKLCLKVVSQTELYELMNTIIADYDKEDGRSGLMARSAFLKLLKLRGVPSSDANDALIHVREKERRILKKWVSFGIIKKISNNCDDSTLQLIIMTQYETCSRIEDMLNLKVNNIDFEDGVIRMTTMKTGISKINALTKHTLEMLKTHIEKKNPDDIVFDMTYWNIWDKERLIVKKLKNAGVLGKDDVHFSSHWLRASRAVHLFKNGVDLETIKREGGWKSVESLLKYLKMAGLDAKQTLEKCTPNW